MNRENCQSPQPRSITLPMLFASMKRKTNARYSIALSGLDPGPEPLPQALFLQINSNGSRSAFVICAP
jgi:hypothetical protein